MTNANTWTLNTPVTLIIFNRPYETQRVFEAIRQARPKKLLVIADGPRLDRPRETELCTQTRAIIDTVDWDCDVLKNYSDINLGCRERIGRTGLPWVFSLVEEAIVLEDDCLPHPSFFQFAETLLQKYRYDERVLAICGTNHLTQWKAGNQSYHFSDHFSPWGWASWRRTWDLYDVNMSQWDNADIQYSIKQTIKSKKRFLLYQKFLNETYLNKNDAWDYQMLFLGLTRSLVSIVPSKNLISNIGFGETATNTSSGKDIRACLPTSPLSFPLKHPNEIEVDRDYEHSRYFRLFDRSPLARLARKLKLA